jgi:hypothetical protein
LRGARAREAGCDGGRVSVRWKPVLAVAKDILESCSAPVTLWQLF